jgi:glycyl-tRNA synthetase
LMNRRVWQASGHEAGFNDPMVVCSNCHSSSRADHIKDDKCPVCGKTGTLGQPRQFNTMFKTHVGPIDSDESVTYLRPETAQGMFTNYKNILDSFYPDLPFGIAQVGKAFRNEISPRDFIFRVRELEIMEFEFFIKESEWEKYFEKWQKDMSSWFTKILGLPADKITEHDLPEDDRAHYSKRTIDFYFDFPHGSDELAGLAYRTDFDLKAHQEGSGKDMSYRPKDCSSPFIPHVIEPTFGVDRHVMAVLSNAYTTDEVEGEKRTYLKLPPKLAPIKAAVFPLLKNKPELVDKAREVYKTLQKEVSGEVMWDDNGNIGKRYRRQDEIGTPYCVTVDFQTLEDDTVTVRSRDTTEQQRVKINEIKTSVE